MSDRIPAATPRVAIIGSGFGGLGLGVRLRQVGVESFTIFDKADEVGGTWRDNTYPGAACDVPSHLYSLSFAPKLDWSRRFPEQPEILDYLKSVATDFGLRSHLRLGTPVVAAEYDESVPGGEWVLTLGDESIERFDVVISATGQLNRPKVPDIPGLDGFDGESFHSARWRHDLDLADRDIAVVGIGASAIQFVPQIAPAARSVTLFQRSVNYVAPKPDGPFSDRTLWAFAKIPALAKLYRASIWARFEARWLWFKQGSRSARMAGDLYRKKVGAAVTQDLPAEALLPRYPLGCRRVLISNDWFPTLRLPQVKVITAPIESVEATGVRAGDTLYPADTVIFGTGFTATEFLTPMRVTGRNQRDLHQEWKNGAEAHLGITVTGFPNLFLLYGPNTNLGHNSIIFMLERQIEYVVRCLAKLQESGATSLEVRPAAQADSNSRLERELAQTVWANDCHSWYKTDTGRITNNWSGPTFKYWWRTARPRWSDFVFRRS